MFSKLAAWRVVVSLIGATLATGIVGPAVGATYVTFDPSNGDGTSPYDINSQGVVSGSYQAGAGVIAFLRTPDGTITTYSVSGASSTFGTSINSAGTVAGSYRLSDGNDHGFIRSADGTIVTFDVSGATETTVSGINKNGDVTGYANGGTLGIGFLRSPDGTITTFQVPGETDGTYPRGINFQGEITGQYCCVTHHSLTVTEGFVRHPDGHIATFLPPHTRATWPLSIIPTRAIAGFYIDFNGNYHGFVRADGRITKLNIAHGSQTEPSAMNINEVITGYYYNGSTDQGFLYRVRNGEYTKFAVPGAKSTYPVSINREGQVTGIYYPSNGGNFRAFVRTP